MRSLYLYGTKEVKHLLLKALQARDLKDKAVLDFPAGSGFSSAYLIQQGARVAAWDAFPEFFKDANTHCSFADLQKAFPAEDETFDLCLFQEGIEHLPNQLFALQEFHRVLKGDGTLFLTTPNYSNFRSRLAYLFFEAETPKSFPPNEKDSIWYGNDKNIYYGHIFSLGIMKLRILSKIAGFEIKRIHPSRINVSSAILGVVLFPLLLIKNSLLLLRSFRKHPQNKRLYIDLFILNMNPTVLLGGHLIVELVKKKNETTYREKTVLNT